MRVLQTDVINTAIFTNKNDFFQFGGHAPELIQDSRLSRVGWFSSESTVSSVAYNEDVYGMSLYGAIVLDSGELVMDFDLVQVRQFDAIGVANHNMDTVNINVQWGTSPGVFSGSATIGPYASDRSDVYGVLVADPVQARYVRITFVSVTLGGILRIGRLMLGLNLALPGYRVTYDSIINSSSIAEISNTRQLYGTRKTTWRKIGLEWAPGDIRETVQALMETLDRHQATLWDFDEACMGEDVIYAHIEDSAMALVHDSAGLYSGRITISEVK